MGMYFLIEDSEGIRKATERDVSRMIDEADIHGEIFKIFYMDAGGLKHSVHVGEKYYPDEQNKWAVIYAIAPLEIRSPIDDRFRLIVGYVSYTDH